jgi:hypothetical protein
MVTHRTQNVLNLSNNDICEMDKHIHTWYKYILTLLTIIPTLQNFID